MNDVLLQLSFTFIADHPRAHRHHIGSTTLSFNLNSKKAFDEGWIVKTKQEPMLDQGNVLEWATTRLRALMKQK